MFYLTGFRSALAIALLAFLGLNFQVLAANYPSPPLVNRATVFDFDGDRKTYTLFKAEFVNFAGGNYQLTAASHGHLCATYGTDVGGNIDSINNATSWALSGIW